MRYAWEALGETLGFDFEESLGGELQLWCWEMTTESNIHPERPIRRQLEWFGVSDEGKEVMKHSQAVDMLQRYSQQDLQRYWMWEEKGELHRDTCKNVGLSNSKHRIPTTWVGKTVEEWIQEGRPRALKTVWSCYYSVLPKIALSLYFLHISL